MVGYIDQTRSRNRLISVSDEAAQTVWPIVSATINTTRSTIKIKHADSVHRGKGLIHNPPLTSACIMDMIPYKMCLLLPEGGTVELKGKTSPPLRLMQS